MFRSPGLAGPHSISQIITPHDLKIAGGLLAGWLLCFFWSFTCREAKLNLNNKFPNEMGMAYSTRRLSRAFLIARSRHHPNKTEFMLEHVIHPLTVHASASVCSRGHTTLRERASDSSRHENVRV
jgi:hypothetical protein